MKAYKDPRVLKWEADIARQSALNLIDAMKQQCNKPEQLELGLETVQCQELRSKTGQSQV